MTGGPPTGGLASGDSGGQGWPIRHVLAFFLAVDEISVFGTSDLALQWGRVPLRLTGRHTRLRGRTPHHRISRNKGIPIMKSITIFIGVALLITGCAPQQEETPAGQVEDTSEWISLFDGESLEGWQASESPETFRVKDGVIVAEGPRSHLYYVGDVMNHDFTNFEFKADVMTEPGSNSGLYFHTEYQEEGWPEKGYEAQINNTGGDPRRTGSLYAIDDVAEAPANDNEWFTEHIIVRGKDIVIMVDGDTLVNYTEPEDWTPAENIQGRYLSSGTFALQGHDPESKVYFRNIMVRPLED